MRFLRCDRFGKRLLIYGAVWLLAVLAFQLFLQPEGITETNLSEIQQRIRWPVYAPLMAVFGLAQSFTWPDFPKDTAALSAIICFVLLGMVILCCAHRAAFVALVCVHALILAVGVLFFIKQSHLPSGG